ncbi:hypothetical protein M422DRAFT_153124 [Sphaerobolus stellatus SS14]|nr:hypothetical protein M422DRAFT_153124 [Sphaerobolus stellatus SS14]
MSGQRPPTGSGGYNRDSFYPPVTVAPVKGGADERGSFKQETYGEQDEGWDVYADFNNAGPRYSSTVYGHGQTNSQGYHQLPVGASKPETPLSATSSTPVELVTVPALGAEWQKSELRAMTSAAKREESWDSWRIKWRSFRRDENGFCGIPWLTRRLFACVVFGCCVVVGIILAFTIPRVPGFNFNNDNPLNGSSHIGLSRLPANFSFDTHLNLQVNTQSNFIPITFTKLHATLFDSDTNTAIGEGEVTGLKFPAKQFINYFMPFSVNYTAVNDTDITWNDLYHACQNPAIVPAGESRPPLKLRLVLDMSIAGLPGHPTASTATNNAPCPFELSVNSI